MHLSEIGPKFFITMGLRPSGPAPLKEPIRWKAFLIFLMVKVLLSLLFLTFTHSKVSTSGTSVWPGKNLFRRIDNESSGLLQYSPFSLLVFQQTESIIFIIIEGSNKFRYIRWIVDFGCKFLPSIIFCDCNCIVILSSESPWLLVLGSIF